jgi:hypothetical protein
MARKLYVKAAKYIVPVVKETPETNNKQIEYTAPNGARIVVKEDK